MKILILKNAITINIDDDLVKVKDYFNRHNIPLDFSFKEIDQTFKSVFATTAAGTQQYMLDKQDALPKVLPHIDKEYDIVILALNGEKFGITRPSGAMFGYIKFPTILISINCDPIDDSLNNTYLQICHEIMHALILQANAKGAKIIDPMDVFVRDGKLYRYYKNNNPDAEDGNFAEAWKRLDNFYQNKYKYFSEAEVSKFKLKPEMWRLLDKLREECGFPFIIESGLRTKAENDALADSVSDSAHLSGVAVDLRITDSVKRLKLIQVALNNGITRIGVGKNFVHLDVDKSKPQGVMWTYYK